MSFKQDFEELMSVVIKENGSDLHLTEGRHPTIRAGGVLIPLLKKSVISHENMESIVTDILSPASKDLLEKEQQVDMSYSYSSEARFRCNFFYQQGKLSLAMRLIPNKILSFEDLNLPPILSSFTKKQQGFFLVVGPTGNGKSTTLAAMIDQINNERTEHIITIEDPIEYVFKSNKSIMEQREVRIDTPSFSKALQGVFRQDIDVLMVGEMREPDTIAAAVTAAETGHLVFSTLHTNDASQTVDRIIDSFPAAQQNQIRLQIAGSLTGIFSMRLIPRISGGLIPAYELLINNAAVSNLIREKRTYELNTVIETSSEQGMISLDRSLADLVRKGEITVENAYQYASDPKTLEKIL